MIKLLYMLTTTTAMGFELIAVMNTTLLSMVGPGLALRGPDGSMHNAVQGMMTHYRFTLACFTLGLVCFMLSALLCMRPSQTRVARARLPRGAPPSCHRPRRP